MKISDLMGALMTIQREQGDLPIFNADGQELDFGKVDDLEVGFMAVILEFKEED